MTRPMHLHKAWPLLALIPFGMGLAAPSASASAALTRLGASTLSAAAAPAADTTLLGGATELHGSPQELDGFTAFLSGVKHGAAPARASMPSIDGALPAGPAISFGGFDGLSHYEQRTADNGNQFSLEPPDQALAVGNGYVVEAVNNALAVYDTSGKTLLGPVSLSRFFLNESEVVRGKPPVFGNFLSDPRALYDAPSGRWFITELEIGQDKAGNFLPQSAVLIAVSKTSDPRGAYDVYALDTSFDPNATDSAGKPVPVFGDQPLIGADANGFYISTNEFVNPGFGRGFGGAQLYALSKTKILAAQIPTVVHFGPADALDLGPNDFAFSIQPAATPPGSRYESKADGTEYFLSSFYTNTTDSRITAWALTNTQSLVAAAPAVTLTHTVLASETYASPPDSVQKAGPTPLGTLLAKLTGEPQPEELLATNDTRMQQVVFSQGKLYSALTTGVTQTDPNAYTGVAYFIVKPDVDNGKAAHFGAHIQHQGYVTSPTANVFFPSVGVNAGGGAAIAFSLAGVNDYPSSAFAVLGRNGQAGPVTIASAGVAPDDGFTGYPAEGGSGSGRWGDYSAAVADESGTIWTATELISAKSNTQRTALANWGTYITKIPTGEGDH